MAEKLATPNSLQQTEKCKIVFKFLNILLILKEERK